LGPRKHPGRRTTLFPLSRVVDAADWMAIEPSVLRVTNKKRRNWRPGERSREKIVSDQCSRVCPRPNRAGPWLLVAGAAVGVWSVGGEGGREIEMKLKQVIVVRKDLNMRKGKLAAQVAHAATLMLLENISSSRPYQHDEIVCVCLTSAEFEWLNQSYPKIVVGVDSEQELEVSIMKATEAGVKVYRVIDEGRTEFHGKSTLTCAAFGPDEAEKLDAITGGMSLL
jgi:peptidyl-tRNA hydrolase, PTH2 family